MISMKKYRAAWKKRDEETRVMNESRRQKALGCARKLSRVLADQFGAKKVTLVGSILHGSRFKANSDIDLAVEGIKPDQYFNALVQCQTAGFPVDLIETAAATPLMTSRIAKGKVLYERR
ncbi:MAG: nucleotidyltransferase domain-containing protein [Chitinivibrionales bacterium]|nr:nucleotidyltransferase domain-containing protein [Chitinivibrionales bacterium]